MFWDHGTRKISVYAITTIDVLAALTLFALTYSKEYGGSAPAPLVPLLAWITQRSSYIYLIAAPTSAVATLLLPFAISRYRQLLAVQKVLDEISSEIFVNLQHLPESERRVTLFKHRRITMAWTRPLLDVMVAIERSGESTRSGICRFRASKDSPDKAEGFAGRSWAEGIIKKPSSDLPFVTIEDQAYLKEYARLTFMSEGSVKAWLEKRRQLPLGICAIPVRVGDTRWGSLVIDSSARFSVDDDSLRRYDVFAAIVGRILEGSRR